MGDGAGRERGFVASRGRFLGHGSWLQFRDELVMTKTSILLPNRHDFCHDRATIAPRSGRDRGFFHVVSAPSDELQLDERSRFTDPVRHDHDTSPAPAVRS